jgi:hypothetical protein
MSDSIQKVWQKFLKIKKTKRFVFQEGRKKK